MVISPSSHPQQLLADLRQLLLSEDRERFGQIGEKLETLEETVRKLEMLRESFMVEDQERYAGLEKRLEALDTFVKTDSFQETLEPYLADQLTYLQENFSTLFGKYIGEAIKAQISNPESQKVIIDALYPIMGKLISNYLRTEIARISEQIDQRLQDPFSFSSLKLRIKALFTGVSYQELLLQSTAKPKIEEVFVIESETGLPMGHFSLSDISHPDMVAGMLTGIKSFVEHAFEKADEDLSTLEYEKYKILLHTFENFYIATVVAGNLNAVFEQKLRDTVFEFCQKHPIGKEKTITKETKDQLSLNLQSHFDGFNHADK